MINRIVIEYFCTNWKKKYRNRSSSLRRAISVSKIWQRFEDSLQISTSMANVTHVYIPTGNNIQFAIRIRIAELWHDTYTCATYLWIRFVNSIRKSVDVSVELIFIVSINIRDFYVNPGRAVSFLRFLVFTRFVIN